MNLVTANAELKPTLATNPVKTSLTCTVDSACAGQDIFYLNLTTQALVL